MVEYRKFSDTFTIPSRIEEIGRALEEVKTYMEGKGYEGVKYRRLIGALYEAITNAVIHGNSEDERKRVKITYFDDQEKFQVSVMDEGDGFDPFSVSDPCSPENILKPCGRGILIIKNFVDELSFNTKGNEITLTIKK